jgi:hypothetical protein
MADDPHPALGPDFALLRRVEGAVINPMRSSEIAELVAALAKAQSAIPPAPFNKKVDFVSKTGARRKYSYADLTAIFSVTKKLLGDIGLAVTQTTEMRGEKIILITTLWHASGQWIASEFPLRMGLEPQEFASLLTYNKRYQYCAILGVSAEEDDDGQAASAGQSNGKAVVVPTGEVLSEEQCQTLVAALEAREMPVKRLMKYVSTVFGDELTEVADIPAELYEQCLKKIQKQGAAE